MAEPIPESFASRFFEQSPDLLAVVHLDGYILYANRAWGDTLGLSADALTQTPLLDLIHPDDRIRFLDEARQLMMGADVIGFRVRFRASDGTYRVLQWSAGVDPTDSLVVYASARDITAEAELTGLLERFAGEPDWMPHHAEDRAIVVELRSILERNRLRVRRAA